MHKLATDVSVNLLEDRPGALAKAAEAIANARINIDGYAEVGGTLHVLTKDAAATRRALESAGCQVTAEQDVVVADVADRPGVAAKIFRRIADAGVNVNFSYVAMNNRIVIGASDVQRVGELVGELTKPRRRPADRKKRR